MAAINADQIRNYVRENYVRPARRSGKKTFTVRVGDVSKALGVSGVNHVCAAIKSGKFSKTDGLRLIESKGPPSGVSTTVEYTYEFNEQNESGPTTQPIGRQPDPSSPSVYEELIKLTGILKDVYRELGGSEKFHRELREGYRR